MRVLIILSFLLFPPLSHTLEASYLYKVQFIRAAPGKLSELIELSQNHFNYYKKAKSETPLWMRHSQGDQWDLMILVPWKSYDDYYANENKALRDIAEQSSSIGAVKYEAALKELSSWREDLYVYGPDVATVKKLFANNALYHVEIFRALPGKYAQLVQQRKMENTYYRNINHVENLIFIRDQGAAWDVFTIGFYRDLVHFAQPTGVTDQQDNEAAIKAGFEGVNTISFYLRSLIESHHDTLARAIK